MLALLEKYKNSFNNILVEDYYNYLNNIENVAEKIWQNPCK